MKFTGCQIQPPTEFSEFGKVEILFEATHTRHASQYAIAQNSMRIVMPNGERFGVDDEFFSMVDRERSGNFEPVFTRPALIRAELTQPFGTTRTPRAGWCRADMEIKMAEGGDKPRCASYRGAPDGIRTHT